MFTWWANAVRPALLCGTAPQVSSEPFSPLWQFSRCASQFEVKASGSKYANRGLTRRTLTEANYGFWGEDGWAIVVKAMNRATELEEVRGAG